MYKRIDVYLGMAVALLVFVVTVPVAKADCRLNESDGNKRFHGPYSRDTDREFRAPFFKSNSTPADGSADSRVVDAYMTIGKNCDNLPAELALLRIGSEPIVVNSDNVIGGETCAYTDPDGNPYALPTWEVKVQKIFRDAYDLAAPRDWCYFGVSLTASGTADDKVNN